MSPTKPQTYAEAMDLLDARRKGANMPESFVLYALLLTGDYDEGKPALRYLEPHFLRLYEPAIAA